MLVGPGILGKQMFADQLPGRCWEVTHSREMPDGLRDTMC